MRKLHRSAAIFVLACTAGMLAVPVPASATYPGTNGRIAYVATVGDHRSIYTEGATGLDPRLVVDLGSGRDAINPAWSWDGTMLAFAGQTGANGPFAIFIASADGSGVPLQITTPSVSDLDPAWSPDGTEIAFTRQTSPGTSEIAIVVVSTQTVTTLTRGLGRSVEPAWSPSSSDPRILFATRFASDPCSGLGCRFQIWSVAPDGGSLQGFAGGFDDLHHPDWSADGSRVVVHFGRDETPTDPEGIRLYSASGATLGSAGLCGIVSEPSFSPDGTQILTTSRTFDANGGLTPPQLCIFPVQSGSQTPLPGIASDAAWGAIDPPPPPPPPPPPDTSPPVIEFSARTTSNGWLLDTFVQVLARDPSGVTDIRCTLDEGQARANFSLPGPEMTGDVDLYGVSDGPHVISCRATDGRGNAGTNSIVVRVDQTPPTLGAVTFEPNPRRVGEMTTATVSATDGAGSGALTGSLQMEGQDFPLLVSGSSMTVTTGEPLYPGIYDGARVAVRDEVGNWAFASAPALVVYDPTGGSTSGSGWIVPGGATSDPGDSLPGLDGKTKASFTFSARYKTGSSTTPTGSFNFNFGKSFKFQSRSLSWLILISDGLAEFQGTGTIQGEPGTFVFWATVQDGDRIGSFAADRLDVKVWPSSSDPFRDPPLFQASGQSGGQIQIVS